MKNPKPFVITINRQLGSGGAYIGRNLAQKLNVFYADREIINQAAQQLSVLEEDLELRDEKILTFWQSFLQVSAFVPDAYMPPQMMPPTDRELYETEAEIIEHIVKERPAVIIGRCGFHILHGYSNHVSIFLHGEVAFRKDRVQKIYNVTKEVAGKMIAQSDKARALYCNTFTGKVWSDARNYDLSIDTSKTDIDQTVDFILNYLELR